MSNHLPVILNITNAVVQNQTANALLAVGASPIMSHSEEEIEDILAFTHAVNLNIGTLNTQQISIFESTLKQCAQQDIPVSFDPVGFGVSKLRNNISLSLLNQYPVSVIKGNAGEIIALEKQSAMGSNTIDSQYHSEHAIRAAISLSKRYRCVVAISGESDYCIESDMVETVSGGSAMMSKVTGMGCIANSLIARFLCDNSALDASVKALSLMAQAGEVAAKTACGPQSFYIAFIDALYQLSH